MEGARSLKKEGLIDTPEMQSMKTTALGQFKRRIEKDAGNVFIYPENPMPVASFTPVACRVGGDAPANTSSFPLAAQPGVLHGREPGDAGLSLPEKQKKKLESLPPTTPIVVQKAVQLGELQNNLYPLKSGLKQGETVVVSNTALLSNGIPVKTAN